MLKISSRGKYGMQAMVALAKNFDSGVLQVHKIAQTSSIPKTYLDQLMHRLKRSGLVESIRGNRGGYKLARAPQDISLLQIIEALEGPGLNSTNGSPDAISQALGGAQKAAAMALDVSLDEILRRQAKLDGDYTFFI